MLEDVLEIRKINGVDVYFRKTDKEAKNKPTELKPTKK